MLNRSSRYLLAAVQAILGWEWLMSGGNKLLAGNFPEGLGSALSNGLKGKPDGWYVNFVQTVILPHSVLFGYLIEISEVFIGFILLGGVLLLLGKPRPSDDAQHSGAVGICVAVMIAAAIAAFQNINFHFWMGGWVLPTFTPRAPYNEGIDLDGLLPPLFLIIIIANYAYIQDLRGEKFFAPLVKRYSRKTLKEQTKAA